MSNYSICGIDCDQCKFKVSHNCKGCHKNAGTVFWGSCDLYQCCKSKGYQHCGECKSFPSDKVLQEALGDDVNSILESFIETITGAEYGLTIEWRYGKDWLCKVTHKKKTVLRLSVWEGFFRTSFHFTKKHLEIIASLDISEMIKEEFCKAKPNGELIPMIIDVNKEEQLADLLTIVRFKKSLI